MTFLRMIHTYTKRVDGGLYLRNSGKSPDATTVVASIQKAMNLTSPTVANAGLQKHKEMKDSCRQKGWR